MNSECRIEWGSGRIGEEHVSVSNVKWSGGLIVFGAVEEEVLQE
jgi:hypothetical protein